MRQSKKSTLQREPKESREQYDFFSLQKVNPELAALVHRKDQGGLSIDFSDPQAVYQLNRALLMSDYGLRYWELPDGTLCPPVPGRADYVHLLAQLLKELKLPDSTTVRGLDLGVGASCIYPILAVKSYNWTMVGADISTFSLAHSQKIVDANPGLETKIDLRHQKDPRHYFEGIIHPEEYYHFSMCNPPFHSSKAAAEEGTLRKMQNLGSDTSRGAVLNFGGHSNELWCDGGEKRFVRDMIRESVHYANQVRWFTCLISKEENLKPLQKWLRKLQAEDVRILALSRGNKKSRVLAWRFGKED